MLTSAALLGSGIGLSLGAAYLAGGMAQAAADHSRVERIAQAAAGGYAEVLLEQEEAGLSPSILRLARGQANGEGRQLAHLKQQLTAQQGSGVLEGARDLECLTQAVYYEARGESPKGQVAVAQVVMNRVKHPAFPKTVCAVVYQGSARRVGCQFSFTCDGSMRARQESGAWERARRTAARVLAGAASIPDVGSATHFHTTQVSPSWGAQMRQVAQVGVHVFYKFSPRKRQLDLQQAVMTASNESITELQLMPTVAEAAATVTGVTAEATAPAPAPQPETTPTAAAEAVTTGTPAAATAS
jgi:spore germination cell wall hydrolase CwlJ-like protein